MNKKMTLDFKELDMEDFLHSALPVRFQDTEPTYFLEFISYFFENRGYRLRPTGYSPDYGVDLILDSQGMQTSVQVRRYSVTHRVGLKEVQQLLKAKQYYQCEYAMFITTSSFDEAAKVLAKREKVILWDWHQLMKALTRTFLEDMPFEAFYERYPASKPAGDSLNFELASVAYRGSSYLNNKKAIVRAKLKNSGNEDVIVECELPSIVTRERKQYRAADWYGDSFEGGTIYAQSTVEIAFYFGIKQFPKYGAKDRIVLTIRQISTGETINLEQKMLKIKRSGFWNR